MELDRRELFRIVAAGVTAGVTAGPILAQDHQHAAAAASEIDIASHKPRALSEAQYKTLDALSEILLPAGDDGPGAHEAGVAYYLDTVLHYGSEAQRESWRRGLDSAAASGPDLEATVARWSKSELSPQTKDEKFFVAFKNAAIGAFYLSAAGRKCAGYRGDTAIATFPGCTHKEHQV